ncbi:zinc metalloprotease HtpX [Helicobacter sp. 13S00401-1]|uniref:zinc metalloprotease HtpX n=1 Tax=Helicobacter sp. 13S00401-1 TaxID=1905758 RepID=UPI000BA7BC61|nr:zinc metalloprotease HtpX [Helicobacter sp. 13S00401-1]PAF49709.1 zinc metalloprotease HtpX [Helicobacter sp. 13S00401-1]
MFQKIINENKRKTIYVLLTYVLIYIIIGLLVDVVRINSTNFSQSLYYLITFKIFPTATVILILASLVVIYIATTCFSKIMLGGAKHKLLDPNATLLNSREREAYYILQGLVKTSKTNFTPKLYVMEAPFMNAFASGWSEDNSLICLTTALLSKLEKDELTAVIAHELSHIRHYDVRLTMSVGILSNILVFVANMAAYFFFPTNRNSGASIARNILFALQLILPLITLVLLMYLSRAREYMADSGAAYIMKDPLPMIRALQKISADYKQTNYSHTEVNPARNAAYLVSIKEAFSTHPSVESRILALQGKSYRR